MKNLIDFQQYQELGNFEFLAREIVEGFITGLHRSPFHGFSVEFAEHRLYNEGESTKHIDWKLFARTDKLFVKRYEEETNLRSQIVIDTSSSMLFPHKTKRTQTKLAFSAICAGALIYMLRKQRDAVGLSLFSNEIETHTHARLSSVHAKMLFAMLEGLLAEGAVEMDKKTSAADALHLIAEKIHKRSLVIIFSDMMDSGNSQELFSAMQHLKHKKHEVILFHVTDHTHEGGFKYENRPYKFVDMETGEIVKINPNDVRGDYVKSMNQFVSDIKLKCGQYHIDMIEADINKDFKSVLLPYLLKRNKLY